MCDLNTLLQIYEGLFGIWQNILTYFGKFLCHWANFHTCMWANIEHIILPSGHTATYLPNSTLPNAKVELTQFFYFALNGLFKVMLAA